MGTLQQLQQQSQHIDELCRVLNVLIKEPSVCQTTLCHEMFDSFRDNIKNHLTLEESSLYAQMLAHSDHDIQQLAGRFKENSREIKKLFMQYEKRWCKNGISKVKDKNREEFIQETTDMFSVILKRIEAESNDFFPIAERAIAA
ncbi:hypothetical protein D5085_16300 [Ectothiorhodospiraceae bacterium BW-2]|nr:hypothetical protein D5085_16300 [Ectothiorhodospiraceae bacterium BW-2]